LIEAAETPFTGSRGKGIQPRTLEIFDDLGIIEPILLAGGPYPRLRIHLGPLSIRAGSLGPSRPPTVSTPYPNLWMVPQSRTEAILRERLSALGGRVEFNTAIVNFQQDQNGVDATLSTGEAVRVDFLIGCDGGHSTVRRALGLKLEGETIDEKPMLVADVEVDGLNRQSWHIWPLVKGGGIGLCPLPNTALFQLTAKAETVRTNLEDAVYRATGHRIGRVVWQSIYQPAVRMVHRYRIGRVFLAGDAAHLHHKRSIKRGDLTDQLGLHYRGSSLSSGPALGDLHPGDRMPDVPLADGSRLFEHMRGPHATEFATVEGPRILIRPDGYIAHIGEGQLSEYAGEPTETVTGSIYGTNHR
jgi:2-polyprenyl-6-methoxyphenol hydroxylase-like FAD-dependent oxidoreductase